jgi:hypothetical protein
MKRRLRTIRLFLEQPPLLGPRGTGIAVRAHGKPALLVFRVARDSSSPPPRPRHVYWSSSWKFLAVALTGKWIGGIEAGENRITDYPGSPATYPHIDFWGMPHFHLSLLSRGLPARAPGDRWLPFLWLTSRSSQRYNRGRGLPANPQRAVVIDGTRNLLSWISPGCHQWVTPDHIDSNVLALSY